MKRILFLSLLILFGEVVYSQQFVFETTTLVFSKNNKSKDYIEEFYVTALQPFIILPSDNKHYIKIEIENIRAYEKDFYIDINTKYKKYVPVQKNEFALTDPFILGRSRRFGNTFLPVPLVRDFSRLKDTNSLLYLSTHSEEEIYRDFLLDDEISDADKTFIIESGNDFLTNLYESGRLEGLLKIVGEQK